jgi:large subunit ribosomal protein L4
MPSVKILNMSGQEQGTVELSDAVFGVQPQDTAVHDAIVGLKNAQHQGTAKTKERAEVRGGGIKPFNQKGTGRARQGSSREPQMRGGGTVFGPRPRSYRQNIPTRVRRQALCCVLSDRLRRDRLSVIDGLSFDAPKTKPFAQMLKSVAPEGRSTLIVVTERDINIILSARNVPRVTIRTAADVNVLDVASAQRVVVQQEALSKLEERLS